MAKTMTEVYFYFYWDFIIKLDSTVEMFNTGVSYFALKKMETTGLL